MTFTRKHMAMVTEIIRHCVRHARSLGHLHLAVYMQRQYYGQMYTTDISLLADYQVTFFATADDAPYIAVVGDEYSPWCMVIEQAGNDYHALGALTLEEGVPDVDRRTTG